MTADATGEAQGRTSRSWGMSLQELATRPTVYRDDLLAGKVMVVSGGGSGIGQGIAMLAARLGAEVVICSRNIDKLRTTAEAAKSLLGRTVHTQVTNIREPESVTALMDFVWRQCGGLDILVNNAGGQFPQPALDLSINGWNSVVDLNLNGSWYMMQAAARRWVERGRAGNIVNIAANVERGMPQVAHTCAARAGVIYLSKSVSTEWAEHDIRVNCVAPGSVESSGFEVYPEGVPDYNFRTSNPMMRVGDVYDVAEAVIYLGTESGKFITGEVLSVDGGMAQWGNPWPGGRPERFKV